MKPNLGLRLQAICCTQNFMAGASTKNWIFSGTHPSLNFKEPSPNMFHYSKHYKEQNIKYKAESELALNIISVHLSHQNTWFLAIENYRLGGSTRSLQTKLKARIELQIWEVVVN